MSAEMIIGSVLAAIILLRWLKWLRGDGENEEFDWLMLALGVVAALTLAWRFLNPLGVHLTAADGSPAHRVARPTRAAERPNPDRRLFKQLRKTLTASRVVSRSDELDKVKNPNSFFPLESVAK
jgi:Na+/melibiose symporter-like transporter